MFRRIKASARKYLRASWPILLGAVVLAAIGTAVATQTTDISRLSIVTAANTTVLELVVFVELFFLFVMLGLAVVVFRRNFEKIRQKASNLLVQPGRAKWDQFSRWTQAVIVGFGSGVVVAVGVGLASYVTTLSRSLAWIGLLATWPFVTYWTLKVLETSRDGSVLKRLVSAVLVGTGYAQLRQLETRTVVAITGFFVALGVGIGLTEVGVGWPITTPIAGLVWVLATMGWYRWYESRTTTRTALAIVDYAADAGELTIKNEGTETVALANATIRDTTYDLYELGVDLRLEPGATRTLAVPAAFSLEPSDAVRELPLGYTLDTGQETAVIHTQDGRAYRLQREHEADDDPAWTLDHQSREPTGASPGTEAAGQD